MRSAASYADQMRALLPRGRAWLAGQNSVLFGLISGLAEEFARMDARLAQLLDEADPGAALELLPEWERLAGLPDACLPVTGSISERQRRVARKIAAQGGQSRAYLIAEAAMLGLGVEIDEFTPMASGFRSGAACYGSDWRFAFRVRVLPFSAETGLRINTDRFHAGSRSGDRLRSFSVAELECVIRRAAPAHVAVMFSYPTEPEPALLFDFLSDDGEY